MRSVRDLYEAKPRPTRWPAGGDGEEISPEEAEQRFPGSMEVIKTLYIDGQFDDGILHVIDDVLVYPYTGYGARAIWDARNRRWLVCMDSHGDDASPEEPDAHLFQYLSGGDLKEI